MMILSAILPDEMKSVFLRLLDFAASIVLYGNPSCSLWVCACVSVCDAWVCTDHEIYVVAVIIAL